MATRPILTYGDQRLTVPNEPVESFGSELEDLVADLFETGRKAPGLGLAAPQVGINISQSPLNKEGNCSFKKNSREAGGVGVYHQWRAGRIYTTTYEL